MSAISHPNCPPLKATLMLSSQSPSNSESPFPSTAYIWACVCRTVSTRNTERGSAVYVWRHTLGLCSIALRTQVFLDISDTATCYVFSILFCLCWIACSCIVVTSKVVTVSSLQLSSVVLLPKLLQKVNKLSLVQPLSPQWPTPVTEGTTCKETTDVPAWPMDSGVGSLLVAVVSILAKEVHNNFDAPNV